jgi:flagellar basal-body rod protein FlgB
MGLFDIVGSTATDALQQHLLLAQDRHRVLADNVANIDTPGYRMKDIDIKSFEKTLGKAIERSRKSNPNAARLQMPSLDEEASASSASKLRGIVFHDDNDRSVEQLMVELQRNASKHSQAANLLRNQMNMLRVVISEKV